MSHVIHMPFWAFVLLFIVNGGIASAVGFYASWRFGLHRRPRS